MLLSIENWPTISAYPSSPSCHCHSQWLSREGALSTLHLTQVTLYLLSGAACNSGLYFCRAWQQSGILKSPCCLQNQSQAAVFKMSPAINCKKDELCSSPSPGVQGRATYEGSLPCTGRTFQLQALPWTVSVPPAWVSKDTAALFAIRLGFIRYYPLWFPRLCAQHYDPNNSLYFLVTGENWEAQSCWVHCSRSHSLCVSQKCLLPGSVYLYLLQHCTQRSFCPSSAMVFTACPNAITGPRDPHFNDDTTGARRH